MKEFNGYLITDEEADELIEALKKIRKDKEMKAKLTKHKNAIYSAIRDCELDLGRGQTFTILRLFFWDVYNCEVKKL